MAPLGIATSVTRADRTVVQFVDYYGLPRSRGRAAVSTGVFGAMKVLIVANGRPVSTTLLQLLCDRAEAVVCADGGATSLIAVDRKPAAVVGDGDSLPVDLAIHWPTVPVVRIADQETTDLQKAIRHAESMGATQIEVVQAIHGELDHVYGALSLLAEPRSVPLAFFDEQTLLMRICSPWTASARAGDLWSLLPLPQADGIETHGLQYPLHGETLTLGGRIGIRNRATSDTVSVTYQRGALAALFPHHLLP